MRVDMARMEKMMTSSNMTSNHSMPMDESTIMSSEMMTPSSNNDDAMREHCKMMPNMMGCTNYQDKQDDMNMMDPMNMNMMQMGMMLSGKT